LTIRQKEHPMMPLRTARFAMVTALALMAGAGATLTLRAQTSPSPYTALQDREIKAIPAERIAGLLEARGLGYALTAELNSYPGPMHVLELAAALKLTPEQEARTRAIMDAMKAEGRVIGARIVDAETHLERMFRMGHIDQERLRAQTAAIGAMEGDLRRAHLAAHLEMRSLLTPEQVAEYDRQRGYGAGGHGSGPNHGQGHGPNHGQGHGHGTMRH
jgi:Spy/CpxP family protein refolding chaperone